MEKESLAREKARFSAFLVSIIILLFSMAVGRAFHPHSIKLSTEISSLLFFPLSLPSHLFEFPSPYWLCLILETSVGQHWNYFENHSVRKNSCRQQGVTEDVLGFSALPQAENKSQLQIFTLPMFLWIFKAMAIFKFFSFQFFKKQDYKNLMTLSPILRFIILARKTIWIFSFELLFLKKETCSN